MARDSEAGDAGTDGNESDWEAELESGALARRLEGVGLGNAGDAVQGPAPQRRGGDGLRYFVRKIFISPTCRTCGLQALPRSRGSATRRIASVRATRRRGGAARRPRVVQRRRWLG